MQAWGLTDAGMVREQNQDAFVIMELSDTCRLAVVCDGMGGARGGSVASRLAMEEFTSAVSDGYSELLTAQEKQALLLAGVERANSAVYEKARSAEDFSGMGTTIVAALVEETAAYVVNVGDSRAYYIGKDGILLVTTDHSFVELMVERGELTREAAKKHPQKNIITRAIGTEETVTGDVYSVALEEGDSLVLCSDGLSNVMLDQEILFEIAHGEQKSDCCQRLLSIAKNRGAPDNVTVVLVSR